jgi:hypothetical protein
MARSRLTDDQHLEIRLTTTARRLARAYVDRAVAVAELQELADGRGDLLALACGRALGGFLALPGSAHPGDLQVPALLLEAGADWTTIAAHTDEARRAAGGHHSTATTGGPPNGGYRP